MSDIKNRHCKVWSQGGTAILVLCLLSACVRLDHPVPNLSVGIGVSQLDLDPGNSGLEISDDTDNSWKIAGGFDLTDRVGVEMFYADLGEALLSNNQLVGYTVSGVDLLAYAVPGNYSSRKGRDGFSLYGRTGVSSVKAQADVNLSERNPISLTLGAGAEYGFGNGLAVRADISAHEADAKYFQLNLVYRFSSVMPPNSPPSSGAPEMPVQTRTYWVASDSSCYYQYPGHCR